MVRIGTAFFAFFIFFSVVTACFAEKGFLATQETTALLKQDILNGVIQVSKTRLQDVMNAYGAPSNITSSETSVVLNYDDLKIEFSKNRYLKKWGYDSFKQPAYTTDINSLRKDLESQKIVGENITVVKIKEDYGEPTETQESEVDGEDSVYYYGNIKMTFANEFTVKKWQGKNLSSNKQSSENLTSGVNNSKKPAEPKSDLPKIKPEGDVKEKLTATLTNTEKQ